MRKYSLNSDKDLLHAAEKKIGELQTEINDLKKHIEFAELKLANFIVLCDALDEHFKIGGPDKVHGIVQDYIARKETGWKAEMEEAKKKMVEGIKDGSIKILNRDEVQG